MGNCRRLETMTEREVVGVLRRLAQAGSSLWTRNSLLYGLSRSSQIVIYLFVASWFKVGSDTDSFFLAYAVVMFALSSVAATTSQVMIPYLKQEPGSAVLLLAAATGLLLFLSSWLIHSSLLLAMAPAAAFGAGSSLLSGRLNFQGVFWKPPVATLLGTVAALLVALLLRNALGLLGVALALSAGEGVRFILSISNFSSLFGRPNFPLRSFLHLLGISALLGGAPLAVRFILDYKGPIGGVTVFSYAWGLMGVLLSFTTIGLTVTESRLWKDLSQQDLASSYRSLLPYILGLSALLMVCTILGGILVLVLIPAASEVLWPLLVFVAGLSLYILAAAALSPMIILRKFLSLARAAVLGNVVAIGGSWVVAGSPVGIIGSAGAMVIGTGLLATLMVRSFSGR